MLEAELDFGRNAVSQRIMGIDSRIGHFLEVRKERREPAGAAVPLASPFPRVILSREKLTRRFFKTTRRAGARLGRLAGEPSANERRCSPF
jgi:hypothetical protein